MILLVNTLITSFAIVLYTGLFVVVLLARPQTESRRVFRQYLAAMILWSICATLIYADQGRAVLWMRMMVGAALGAMMAIFAFSQTTINVKSKWELLVVIFGLIGIGICILTDWVVISASVASGIILYEFSNLIFVIALPGYGLVFYSIGNLVVFYRKSTDPVQKNRLLYVILGLSLIIFVSGVNFTDLGKYPIDVAGNAFTALLIAYAILRYQLLDIRIVVRQGLLYSIPTIIIGATYFLSITLALNLFNVYSGIEIFFTSLVVAVVTAIIAEPVRVRAQTAIDRLFFREKYDSTLMLQSLSSSVATVLDLYKITNMILDEVCSTLHIPEAAFFLRDEVTNRFQLTAEIGHEGAQQIEFRQGHPLVLWLSTHDKPLSRHDLEVQPQFQSLWRSERQDLEKLNTELFIPIKVLDVLVGIFLVGAKRSEQAYTVEDILTLTTVGNQTAVAIENARLYTSEQTRLRELDTLYAMARQLVITDNLEDVVATVAEHAASSIETSSAKIITREENGDYVCRAVYSRSSPQNVKMIGKKEALVSEHFYNWILQDDQIVVLRKNDPSLHKEEAAALFTQDLQEICLAPLKGINEYVGLLILGNDHEDYHESFSSTKLRLIEVISDYATSAIQRAVLHQRLEETFLETIVALANAVDARDTYTGDHSQRMANLTTLIATEMGLPNEQIEALHWASILHDIGKIGVPDEILNKTGSLTKDEWVIMKEHPVTGAEIVAPIKYLQPVSPIIRAHHEKYDGSGYPYGLAGKDIPLGARILSVVDAYIAIRDERIYSKSHTHEEAIAELRRSSGSHFDPEIVDFFCKTITV